MSSRRRAVPLSVLGLLVAAMGVAQAPQLTLPRPSPAASVSQTIGLTEVTVHWSRPRVQGREIWGALVPWGEVWRAGANENTTIEFSTPVTVGGQPLAAGRYGFHAVPTPGEWTLIFSRVDTGWGSFGYREADDALRIPARAESAPHTEALSYQFDDVTDRTATLALRWEKLRVPFEIAVDTPEVVHTSLQREMRGLGQFFWQSWNQAAGQLIADGVHLDVAREWIDRSLNTQRAFANLRTLARLQEATGDREGSKATMQEAIGLAGEADLNLYGYELLGNGDTAGAIAIFRQNVERHPESWNVHDSLAEGLAAAGETKAAIAGYQKALSMAPPAQHERIRTILARLQK